MPFVATLVPEVGPGSVTIDPPAGLFPEPPEPAAGEADPSGVSPPEPATVAC